MNPFELRTPTGATTPVLFDSPHSGRFYPKDFRFKPPHLVLRQGEDAYVDELIADAAGHGVTLLLANYPRCYVDANREPDDIDAELLAEPWPEPLRPTEKTRKGLGLIRRYVTPGIEVNRDKLTVAEVRHRIDNIYWPYHRALVGTLDRLRRGFGFAWHVDWHSMKARGNAMAPDGDGSRRPDFVIGDLEGSSCEPALRELVVETLGAMGYRVAINDPYKGAAIVRRYGLPAERLHSIQIEINRGLYLDETAVARNGGFAALRQNIAKLTARLAAAARDKAARS